MWPRQNNARTWTQGASYKGHYLGPVYTTKTEYLRECSVSRVWPYMHQLRIIVFGQNVGFAWLLCFGALRSALPTKVEPGELLRLCPGSSGRAPQ